MVKEGARAGGTWRGAGVGEGCERRNAVTAGEKEIESVVAHAAPSRDTDLWPNLGVWVADVLAMGVL